MSDLCTIDDDAYYTDHEDIAQNDTQTNVSIEAWLDIEEHEGLDYDQWQDLQETKSLSDDLAEWAVQRRIPQMAIDDLLKR